MKDKVEVQLSISEYIQLQQLKASDCSTRTDIIEEILTFADEYNELVAVEKEITKESVKPLELIHKIRLSDGSNIYLTKDNFELCLPRGVHKMLNMSLAAYNMTPVGTKLPIIENYIIVKKHS